MNLPLCILTALSTSFFPAAHSEKLEAPVERYPSGWNDFHSHPGFYPYLSELSYRMIADHVIDPNNPIFDPSIVKAGDVIYCAVWFLDWFTLEVHEKIPNPYILMTCDVGSWLPSPAHMKLIYDPKVVCWFAKNMLFTNHSKFFQLPMGQIYALWALILDQTMIKVLNQLTTEKTHEKDILLYLNHSDRDHGRRIEVTDRFWDKPYCFNRNRPCRPISFVDFWNEVARSKFVLSPLGLEVDCTRTWECFVLGAIPIVEHSYLDPLYDQLQILLIHDWSNIDENFLQKKYIEIQAKPHSVERAYLNYWANLIHEKQKKIQTGDLTMGQLESTQFSQEDLLTLRTILLNKGHISSLLIYQGNMTCLRPFQIAKEFSFISTIYLNDLWTEHGHHYIRQFSQDPDLINLSRVKLTTAKEYMNLLSKPKKTVFIDLTHFRHKLFNDFSPLIDFKHSLETDLLSTHEALHKGDLLLGNMSEDPYVKEVLERIRIHKGINIETTQNFWFCVK